MKKALIGALIILIVLSACAQNQSLESDIQTAITKTQNAAVDQAPEITQTPTFDTFELTRQVNQTKNAAYQETQNVKQTSTPRPTKSSTTIPTSTPKPSIEDLREELKNILINFLDDVYEIDNINLILFDGNGTLEIEVRTTYASQDHQPDTSYVIIQQLAFVLTEGLGDRAAAIIFGGDTQIIHLVTYSTMGDYRYESYTNWNTSKKLHDKEISYEEWVTEADAGFK